MQAILKIIWAIVGPTIVDLALSVGLPKAMEWLMSKGLPTWIVEGLMKIIKEAIGQIKEIPANLSRVEKKAMKKDIKKKAKAKAAFHCANGGVGCPIDTKEL